MPKSPLEWLERQHELRDTVEVQLDYGRNAKYPDVVAHRVGDLVAAHVAANDNQEPPANDNKPSWAWEMEDSIPF